jgi:hypothetical protein
LESVGKLFAFPDIKKLCPRIFLVTLFGFELYYQKPQGENMAIPIKETPVLKGSDAVRFIEQMHKAESKPAPKKQYELAKKLYEKIQQKNKNGF